MPVNYYLMSPSGLIHSSHAEISLAIEDMFSDHARRKYQYLKYKVGLVKCKKLDNYYRSKNNQTI